MNKMLLVVSAIVIGSLGGIAWGYYVLRLPIEQWGVCSAVGMAVGLILFVLIVETEHRHATPARLKRLPTGKMFADRLRPRSFKHRLDRFVQRVVPYKHREKVNSLSTMPFWSSVHVRRRQSLKSPLKIRKILQRIHDAWHDT